MHALLGEIVPPSNRKYDSFTIVEGLGHKNGMRFMSFYILIQYPGYALLVKILLYCVHLVHLLRG